MSLRIDYKVVVPGAYQALLAQSEYVHATEVDPVLLNLIHTRASQINGCGFCLDMHTREARAAGETEQRLYLLGVWREVSLFDPRERAILALTEAVTEIAANGVPDAVYQEVAAFFTEQEIVHLLMAIVSINSWNRMGVALRMQPPRRRSSAAAPDL